MTRDEAINIISQMIKDEEGFLSDNTVEAHKMAIQALEQKPKTEKDIKMRDVTPEEREIINNHIKSISKPTGVDFWDLYKEPCEDAVSRQAVLEQTYKWSKDEFLRVTNPFDYLRKRINSLSPINPQPKTGHWEHGGELSRVFIGGVLKGINYEDWHCSNCHCVVEQSIKPKWSYCPNCGAKMVEPQESEG